MTASIDAVMARISTITATIGAGPQGLGDFAGRLGAASGVLGASAADVSATASLSAASLGADSLSGSALAYRPGSGYAASTDPYGLVTSGALAPAATTADGTPAELAAYGNGQIPREVLTPLGQGDHRLWRPAAESFQRMAAAAAADGVQIAVSESYRDLATQHQLADQLGLYSEGGLAAEPGTSDHGWGRAIDIDDNPSALAWMRANAGAFGFRENVAREPWHWTYLP